MFVLDTNTVIYFFKGAGKVAANFSSRTPKEIVIPTVVIYELEVGIAKSQRPTKRRKQLDTLIDAVQVVPFGLNEAKTAARIRAELERAGTPIGQYDTLIAATALAQSALLVTRNTREFAQVPGLRLIDWY